MVLLLYEKEACVSASSPRSFPAAPAPAALRAGTLNGQTNERMNGLRRRPAAGPLLRRRGRGVAADRSLRSAPPAPTIARKAQSGASKLPPPSAPPRRPKSLPRRVASLPPPQGRGWGGERGGGPRSEGTPPASAFEQGLHFPRGLGGGGGGRGNVPPEVEPGTSTRA